MSTQPASGARRGRKLGPIADTALPRHRQWLEQAREAYHECGLTYQQLADVSRWPQSKISELLRAIGRYPRWEITRAVLSALGCTDPSLATLRTQWVLLIFS
ncbi:helix-turn-helix domain-containing protein [Streptomyces sp. NRRL B-1347]|uniref:helix-turn-helix domain-containing protein n=1 Tax=Streptomyces sp. NRRL B-1347 TaxID=1476877 RepID=UPI000D142DE6|nr:helix-turn-helix transcriptional regulator [Streptomyces sp. NRRL B-1347]